MMLTWCLADVMTAMYNNWNSQLLRAASVCARAANKVIATSSSVCDDTSQLALLIINDSIGTWRASAVTESSLEHNRWQHRIWYSRLEVVVNRIFVIRSGDWEVEPFIVVVLVRIV